MTTPSASVSRPLTCPPVQNGLISTLNHMGYMIARPEALNQAFIDFAATTTAPVLEIGSAYGLASRLALQRGATVVANDLDARHLDILAAQVSPQDRPRLQLCPGRMPEDLDFAANSFQGILASRVLNFIAPAQLPQTFALISHWLQPGGRFFFLGGTPYLGTYAPYLAQYHRHRAQGHPWPGFIEDMTRYTDPRRRANLPDFVTLLDRDEVTKLMTDAGLTVMAMDYEAVDAANPDAMKGDGREYLAAIAVK